MAEFTNPYAPPEITAETAEYGAKAAQQSWKKIAHRWEILRLVYNGIVGLVGLAIFFLFGGPYSLDDVFSVIVYGLAANVFYLLGPIMEMYLNWFADASERKILPGFLVSIIRTPLPTAVLFLLGTLFSILVTLATGLSLPL